MSMGTTWYGVDAVEDSRTLMPYLKGLWGTYPIFACRYIGSNYSTSKDEIDYLLSLGIRFAAVYNARAGVEYTLATAQEGKADAQIALAILADLCPGARPVVFRDIESGQSVTADYLLAWSTALAQNDWPGGFYLPTAQATYASVYGQVVPRVARKYRLLWAASWIGYSAPEHAPAWNPPMVGADPLATVAWQFANQPRFDANLWTADAYGYALNTPQAAQPMSVIWRTVKRVGLKQQPNTSSGLAIDDHRLPVVVELGAIVDPWPDIHGREKLNGYRHVRLPDTKAHGWMLDKDIAKDTP
jgi:hypothetical protein